MTTITTQLADALRAMLDSYAPNRDQHPPQELIAAVRVADEALAAYDAQQPRKYPNLWDDEDCVGPLPASGHTPEPWRASDYATSGGSSGACIMVGDDTVLDLPYCEAWSSEVQDANARRIVACVNACAGIPTDKLEQLTPANVSDALRPFLYGY